MQIGFIGATKRVISAEMLSFLRPHIRLEPLISVACVSAACERVTEEKGIK